MNKTRTDLGIRDDTERLDEQLYSRHMKKDKEGEMKSDPAESIDLCVKVHACEASVVYLLGHVCMFLCIQTVSKVTPGQGVL